MRKFLFLLLIGCSTALFAQNKLVSGCGEFSFIQPDNISRDEAKKAVATGFFALIWTMNTMFMSADIMYTIAEFICSLSLLIIVYDVITLEEKKPKVIVERRANRS